MVTASLACEYRFAAQHRPTRRAKTKLLDAFLHAVARIVKGLYLLTIVFRPRTSRSRANLLSMVRHR